MKERSTYHKQFCDMQGKENYEERHYNDVFADIFNNLLFDGRKILRAEDLTSLPTEGHTRDVAGKTNTLITSL